MIEFENVSFSYTGQEHGGLRDINLKISDGEFVLFCGRSGCGKTTITSQALAAIDWQAANINQIDAAHAADYTRFHIERQILDGMELGDTQGKQIQQTAQTANAWAHGQ